MLKPDLFLDTGGVPIRPPLPHVQKGTIRRHGSEARDTQVKPSLSPLSTMNPRATTAIPGPTGSSRPQAIALRAMEPPLIHNFDDVFCIVMDDNTSMIPQWPNIRMAVADLFQVVNACGINRMDLHFLNLKETIKDADNATTIMNFFNRVRPSGNALLGVKLEILLRAYLHTLQSPRPWTADSGFKQFKPMNYLIVAENLLAEDRRRIEHTLKETTTWLTEHDFSPNQIHIFLVQIGWYNPLPREEFEVLRLNLLRMGISNVAISLGPDSQREGPETNEGLFRRLCEASMNLLSVDFGTGNSGEHDISALLEEAVSSALPFVLPKTQGHKKPIMVVNPQEVVLTEALETGFLTEITLEQALNWTTNLRRIITGKRAPTDQDFALAIDVLNDVDSMKYVISLGVLKDSNLRSTISRLAVEEFESPTLGNELLSSRLWLLRKAKEIQKMWDKKYGPGPSH